MSTIAKRLIENAVKSGIPQTSWKLRVKEIAQQRGGILGTMEDGMLNVEMKSPVKAMELYKDLTRMGYSAGVKDSIVKVKGPEGEIDAE